MDYLTPYNFFCRVAIALAMSPAVVSCASPPSSQPGAPKFVAPAQPPSGKARLYVFRPGFSDSFKRETPTLTVNGLDISALPHESYIELDLPPGRYAASLKPGRFDAKQWSSMTSFTLDTGKIYFLAIWMNFSTERGVSWVALPGGPVPLLPISSNSVRADGPRYEFVPEDQALPVLVGLPVVQMSAPTVVPQR